MKELSIVELL